MKLIDKERLLKNVKKRHYTSSSIKLIEDQKEIKAIPIKWLKESKEWLDLDLYEDKIKALIDEWEEDNKEE